MCVFFYLLQKIYRKIIQLSECAELKMEQQLTAASSEHAYVPHIATYTHRQWTLNAGQFIDLPPQ